MERTLRFYKEASGRWYADIPEWTGSKEELEMILGANVLLDIITDEGNEANVQFSDEPFAESESMMLIGEGVLGDISHGGGTYRLHTYQDTSYDLELWLCDVTKFVFGGTMPQMIYFK